MNALLLAPKFEIKPVGFGSKAYMVVRAGQRGGILFATKKLAQEYVNNQKK